MLGKTHPLFFPKLKFIKEGQLIHKQQTDNEDVLINTEDTAPSGLINTENDPTSGRGKSKYKILDTLSLKKLTDNEILKQISNDSGNFTSKFSVPKISNLSFEKEKKERHMLNFKINKPGKIIETIENIGNPNHLESKAFKIVLKDIYFTVSSNSYNLSLESR